MLPLIEPVFLYFILTSDVPPTTHLPLGEGTRLTLQERVAMVRCAGPEGTVSSGWLWGREHVEVVGGVRWGFPGASDGKESGGSAGDPGLISRS